MGIQLTDAENKPSIVYNQIFLMRLDVRQTHRDNDSDPAHFYVNVRYRVYGVDVDGNRYYDGKGVRTIRLPDYLAEAAIRAAAGKPELLTAFAGIEAAVASIVADAHSTTATIT